MPTAPAAAVLVLLASAQVSQTATPPAQAGRSVSDRVAGSSRVRGDSESVVVYQAGSYFEALPLAIGHCARFGRSAQGDGRTDDGGRRFRCVAG